MTISAPPNQPAVLIVCKAQSFALEITQHTQTKQQSTRQNERNKKIELEILRPCESIKT